MDKPLLKLQLSQGNTRTAFPREKQACRDIEIRYGLLTYNSIFQCSTFVTAQPRSLHDDRIELFI